LLQVTGRPGEAEPLLRRALAIDEKHYGPDHIKVAADLTSLTVFLLRTDKRPREAEPVARRALAIFEKSFGPDNPDVAAGLNNLGVALLSTDRLDEAEPLFRRALAIDEKSYGANHPNTKRVRGHLQELQEKQASLHRTMNEAVRAKTPKPKNARREKNRQDDDGLRHRQNPPHSSSCSAKSSGSRSSRC
jgi:tetratricopeptide (TPR) repeat protein